MSRAARSSIVALVLLAGCAGPQGNPADPLEPMNRVIYRFNDAADRAVVKPVAQGYKAVVPQPARTAVGNFFDNLRDVVSLVNHTLQAKPDRAVNDLMRVALNSTFGLFGLIDIADPAGLKNYKTGFGDTLAVWGWKNSSYLVLPIFGPSTVRDGIGTAVNTMTPPPRTLYANDDQIYLATGLNLTDRRAALLGLETAVQEAALDPYIYTRDAYLQYRARQLGQPTVDTQDVNIDELVSDDGTQGGGKQPASAPAGVAKPASAQPPGKDASGAQ
jgi:phospholipid-binding lipoprotein MlaA